MLTYEDCLGLCELTPEEIRAIAEHEHIPEVIAIELGNYLCETTGGQKRIRRIIIEDIEAARGRHDEERVQQLHQILGHFLALHKNAV